MCDSASVLDTWCVLAWKKAGRRQRAGCHRQCVNSPQWPLETCSCVRGWYRDRTAAGGGGRQTMKHLTFFGKSFGVFRYWPDMLPDQASCGQLLEGSGTCSLHPGHISGMHLFQLSCGRGRSERGDGMRYIVCVCINPKTVSPKAY